MNSAGYLTGRQRCQPGSLAKTKMMIATATEILAWVIGLLLSACLIFHIEFRCGIGRGYTVQFALTGLLASLLATTNEFAGAQCETGPVAPIRQLR
jgi:hypothetical protein